MTFHNPIRYGLKKELFIATEGMYSGQFVYCGKKAALTIGNVKPIGDMPEGSIVCNVEEVCLHDMNLALGFGCQNKLLAVYLDLFADGCLARPVQTQDLGHVPSRQRIVTIGVPRCNSKACLHDDSTIHQIIHSRRESDAGLMAIKFLLF